MHERVASRCLALALLVVPGCYLSHERDDVGRLDAAAQCAPMDARHLPGCTVGVDGWWSWDGAACVASSCACSGADCGRTFGSERACLGAYQRCVADR